MLGRWPIPTVTCMNEQTGEAFVAAVAARDFAALRGSLAEDVRLRLLVPRGPQANTGADETLARFAGWFGAADELRVESSPWVPWPAALSSRTGCACATRPDGA